VLKKENITYITLLISIIVALFGDNIVEKFSGVDLIYSEMNNEIKYPISEKGNLKELPNFYNEIVIQNVGDKPSKDIKIGLNLNTEIYSFKITTFEIVEKSYIDKNNLIINLKNLPKNGEIKVQIWTKRPNALLEIITSDDNENRKIKTIPKFYYFKQILGVVSIMVITIVIIFLVYQKIKVKFQSLNSRIMELENVIKKLTKENLDLENEKFELFDKNEELSKEVEELEKDKPSESEVIEKIREIMGKK